MPKILVTGCSSGFGLSIAKRFLAGGWDVAAAMRHPDKDVLPEQDRLQLLALDVTDAGSIARAVEEAGAIDALVNNAGVGLLNALEGTDIDKARDVFETNTLGPIALTKAVMPQFRMRRTGVIVNVSSSVTLRPLPALSVYTASKAALNAFTESLALEAALFNIRVRIVLPGASPETAFGRNAVARMGMDFPEPYQAFVEDYIARLRASPDVTRAEDVGDAVWQAVTDPDAPMRIPAGADATTLFRDAQARGL